MTALPRPNAPAMCTHPRTARTRHQVLLGSGGSQVGLPLSIGSPFGERSARVLTGKGVDCTSYGSLAAAGRTGCPQGTRRPQLPLAW
jgi:hypothetical protein